MTFHGAVDVSAFIWVLAGRLSVTDRGREKVWVEKVLAFHPHEKTYSILIGRRVTLQIPAVAAVVLQY